METTNEVVIKAAEVPAVKSQIRTVAEGVWFPIRDILVPDDARSVSPEGLDSLAADMNRQGQLESALLIRQPDGTHKLVFGNRRLAAARKVNWEKLKVDIKENVSESERLQMILSENGEREDASPFYVAHLYNGIMAAEGIEPVALATKLGKTLGHVSQMLALARLPEAVKDNFTRVKLDFTHIRELIRLTDPEQQIKLAAECAAKDLSVKALKACVDKLLKPAGSKAKEGKQAVQDTILDCHFVFDGKEVAVKPRRFRMGKETFDEYLLDIKASLTQFVTGLQGGVYQQPEATSEAA